MPAYVENNNYHNLNVKRNSKAESSVSVLNTSVDAVSEYQYGLERLSASQQGLSNPPFKLTSNTNKLVTNMGVSNSGISRGYIRRSSIDAADPTSNHRLYFMFNPESIQRNYMAYLDQQSLDPYNTLFGSNNMTAPPGILDFSFDLLFDRQLEVATDPDHKGTKVDFDFFDIVVRGVVNEISNNGSAIPDNGIMMTNPRNIAVVFGNYLTVHGRPYNAAVSFEKFNNRMTPTRMTISITMKAFYIGPVQTLPNYSEFTAESIFQATIPYDETVTYEANFVDTADARLTDRADVLDQNDPVNSGFTEPSTRDWSNGYDGPLYYRPADIPTGPFPIRIIREGQTMVVPNADPVTLTGEQVLELLLAMNCPLEGAVILWAIAKRESGFVTNNAGVNWFANMDVGLWQINTINWGGRPAEDFTDPWLNVRTAMRLSNNGTNFSPWKARPSVPDSYLDNLNVAEAREFIAQRIPGFR